MDWLVDYALFVAKAGTVFVLVAILIGTLRSGKRSYRQGFLHVESLSARYRNTSARLALKPEERQSGKDKGKGAKSKDSEPDDVAQMQDEPKGWRAKRRQSKLEQQLPTVYVLDFVGDVRATQVASLREEVSATLAAAREGDEVLVRLDSGGGTVTGYGLVAAQLARLRQAELPLTVAINQVAASGGYLAACVADKLMAAPFAIIGSIGVILQMPNLNRLLQEHKVDYEQITAGRNKRHLTLFGEVGEPERERAREELDRIHKAFLDEVGRYRDKVDLKTVGEGDIWLAAEALELGLVDELGTSDDWLMARRKTHRLLQLKWRPRKPLRSWLQTVAEPDESLFQRRFPHV